MASKCSLLAFTVVCLVIAGTSASPGPCQDKFVEQTKKLKMVVIRVTLTGAKCSAFDYLKPQFARVMTGCPEKGKKLQEVLKKVREYVCRCITNIRDCSKDIKTHVHFCEKFEEAANCTAMVVETGCQNFRSLVNKILRKGEAIFEGTCKAEKCDRLFQRNANLINCVFRFRKTAGKNYCGAPKILIRCMRGNMEDCKYLTDKYGKSVDRIAALTKKRCPASEVRGFDLLRGLDSVDLFDAVDQKISDFSEDADQKSSDFSEEALDEMMRDLAEPAETRDTDDIASLKKLIDLLKVMDAKN